MCGATREDARLVFPVETRHAELVHRFDAPTASLEVAPAPQLYDDALALVDAVLPARRALLRTRRAVARRRAVVASRARDVARARAVWCGAQIGSPDPAQRIDSV